MATWGAEVKVFAEANISAATGGSASRVTAVAAHPPPTRPPAALDVSAAAAAVAMVAVRNIGGKVDEDSAASAALELEVVMGGTAGR